MFENAVYSVITPEGCAAILWKDIDSTKEKEDKAKEAYKALKLTAPDLLSFGIIDRMIPEPPGGAHEDDDDDAQNLKVELSACLGELRKPQLDQ